MAVLCVAMLLALCACDSGIVSTVMTIDDSFAGTRTMELDIKKSDLGVNIGGLFGTPMLRLLFPHWRRIAHRK